MHSASIYTGVCGCCYSQGYCSRYYGLTSGTSISKHSHRHEGINVIHIKLPYVFFIMESMTQFDMHADIYIYITYIFASEKWNQNELIPQMCLQEESGGWINIKMASYHNMAHYVTSSYLIWIFCRGVSGFATDCPCGVWCSGLTTCLLHVGPPFGNGISNNSWAVGLT